jgi:hypothetical protein
MMNERQDDEDRAERRAFAIDDRVVELMQPGEACDPFDGFNLYLAFENLINDEIAVLGKLLAEKNFQQAGIFLYRIISDYWSEKAYEKAEDELA